MVFSEFSVIKPILETPSWQSSSSAKTRAAFLAKGLLGDLADFLLAGVLDMVNSINNNFESNKCHILTLTELKLQLLFAFLILSSITVVVVLLMMMAKNSRSQKIRTLCQNNNWQYQEFINFNDTIKQANFGLLNYSQNIIFRHIISADDSSKGIGFNVFDCRAIEPMGIHNCSAILVALNLPDKFFNLHFCLSPQAKTEENKQHTGVNKAYFERIRTLQKLVRLPQHFAFTHHDLYTNNLALVEIFIEQILARQALNQWILAYPHLHIEISNGMLLAYQPNQLLDEENIIPNIDSLVKLAKSLI